MAINVLVADPNEAFATMIKQVLEETGNFVVVPTASGEAALAAASLQSFDMAILETELDDMAVDALVASLRETNAMIAVMLIPPLGEETPPEFAHLDVQGYLPKPFFVPELEPRIEAALNRPVGGVTPAPRKLPPARAAEPQTIAKSAPARNRSELPPTPPWLQDVNKAARYLTTLSLESAAEASLLTRGQQLYAYAGHFPREEVEELARIVADNWTREPNAQGALVRFVQMPNGQDHLLYSTQAAADLVLSMIFQAETPLGMIRKQARRVAEALLTKPELGDAGPAKTVTLAEEAQAESKLVGGERIDTGPAPVPAPDRQSADAAPPAFIEVDVAEGEPALEPAVEPFMAAERDAEVEPAPEEPAAAEPEPVPADAPALQGAYGTHYGLYLLSYTFVWLPKFPHVQLRGDIVESLDRWMRHLALAYDWRVEDLDIQPEFVQLVIACAPSDPPEKVVQTMMRTTSHNIMNDFPRLAEEHPAGSFWAPGYYVIAPGRLLDADEIARYIEYQRREQGIR
ncbi:MAG: IS200/IS605 family transposase [Anaerolineales bacterium]